MAAFYNENDPFAAAWLRNLITAGLIPDGLVDERSIVDLEPSDLAGFKQCHFFAGIGGWPLALALAGIPEDAEVWTGSCPCQPLSVAGKRQGHADERHLWPAFYRLIAECKPAIVFGEQVASADGREWLAGVRADLEAAGYACGGANLPACGVGAPHRRERLFWGALEHSDSGRARAFARDVGQVDIQTERASRAEHDAALSVRASSLRADDVGAVADSSERAGQWNAGSIPRAQAQECSQDGSQHGDLLKRSANGGDNGGMADAAGARRHGARQYDGGPPPLSARSQQCGDGGGVADTEHSERRSLAKGRHVHHGHDRGRDQAPSRSPACSAADDGVDIPDLPGREHGQEGDARRGVAGQGQPDHRAAGGAGFWDDAEWRVGADGKGRRVKSGVRLLVAGFPNRVGLLRGFGNAIVPQVAAQFISAFIEAAMSA